ncbi:unnamed protein product, partial [Polarella glacialis]
MSPVDRFSACAWTREPGPSASSEGGSFRPASLKELLRCLTTLLPGMVGPGRRAVVLQICAPKNAAMLAPQSLGNRPQRLGRRLTLVSRGCPPETAGAVGRRASDRKAFGRLFARRSSRRSLEAPCFFPQGKLALLVLHLPVAPHAADLAGRALFGRCAAQLAVVVAHSNALVSVGADALAGLLRRSAMAAGWTEMARSFRWGPDALGGSGGIEPQVAEGPRVSGWMALARTGSAAHAAGSNNNNNNKAGSRAPWQLFCQSALGVVRYVRSTRWDRVAPHLCCTHCCLGVEAASLHLRGGTLQDWHCTEGSEGSAECTAQIRWRLSCERSVYSA